MKGWNKVAVLGLVLGAAVGSAQAQEATELSIGMYRLVAEVAHTPKTREVGLMHRRAMPENQGMVFVFTRDDKHCMWMANTLLPLSVAFLDEKGQIVNIEDMEPLTRNSHCAEKPARYALEMNAGWFRKRNISPGASLVGVAQLPAGQ